MEGIPINRNDFFEFSEEGISAGSRQEQCFKLLIDSVPWLMESIGDAGYG